MSGAFIVVEGGEASGKSTLIRHLLAHFQAHGRAAIGTREPGGSAGAEAIRRLFLADGDGAGVWSAHEAVALLSAARANHLRVTIEPAIAAGAIVLCDRFYLSTMIYQSVLGGAARDYVEAMHHWVCGGRQPDLTLLLDLAPEAAMARLRLRGHENRFDRMDLAAHARVRAAFLDFAAQSEGRMKRLDASEAPEQVAAAALAELAAFGLAPT